MDRQHRQRLLYAAGPALVLLLAACSREALQRTGYETLQNIGEQQCDRELSSQCPPRDRYESYQRQRSEPGATDP